jgi:hypothetical protein
MFFGVLQAVAHPVEKVGYLAFFTSSDFWMDARN